MLHGETELKRQELNDANSLAEVTTKDLKSELWVVSRNLILIFHYKKNFWLVILPGVSSRIDRLKEEPKEKKKIKWQI